MYVYVCVVVAEKKARRSLNRRWNLGKRSGGKVCSVTKFLNVVGKKNGTRQGGGENSKMACPKKEGGGRVTIHKLDQNCGNRSF